LRVASQQELAAIGGQDVGGVHTPVSPRRRIATERNDVADLHDVTRHLRAIKARKIRAFDIPKHVVAVGRLRAHLKPYVRIAPNHAYDLTARFDKLRRIVFSRRVVCQDN
jgi:hypothetical protein